jgi:chromate transporter
MNVSPPTLGALARGFFRIGLTGFGGVGPVARHVIVVKRNWLDDVAYARLLGFCQALPGANTVNLAVILGDRHHGLRGAVICLLALMVAPLLLLVALLGLYTSYGHIAWVDVALTGAAASAAGLIFGTAAKLLQRSRPQLLQLAIAATAFGLVAGLGLSIPLALAVTAPPSIVLMMRKRNARG